jgi:putative phage-type endonuclease
MNAPITGEEPTDPSPNRRSGLTAEQLAKRRQGVGASEISAVCGMSPWATPLDVWRSKAEGLITEETPAMKRGRILERAVADWYEEETGLVLLEGHTLTHKQHPLMLATPDRYVFRERPHDQRPEFILQIKTTNFRAADEWGEPGTDEIPLHVILQVQQEMEVTDMPRADVAVLISGDDFRRYTVTRDREIGAMLVNAIAKFWRDYVVTGKPPPIDASESWADYLRDKYPAQTSEKQLQADATAERWAGQLFGARQAIAEAEEREREARNALEAWMGEVGRATGENWSITWRKSKDVEKTDWRAIALEAGVPDELIQKHTTFRPGARAFRPVMKKEKSDG